MLAPGLARGLDGAITIGEPASASEEYGGFRRKLLRLGNPAGSLASVHVSETGQLGFGILNDAGTTWTDTTIGDGPFASVTVYAWSAVVDPATHNVHVAFTSDPRGAIGRLGYAMGTYAAFPADPTYSWTITGGVAGPMANQRFDAMTLAFAPVGGTAYLDLVCGRSSEIGAEQHPMRWGFRRASEGVGEWWTVPDGLAPGTEAYIEDEANPVWPEEWDTGGHYYLMRVPGDADVGAGLRDLLVPAGTALTFTARYAVTRAAAAAMERRETAVKAPEAAIALAAAQSLESARGGMEELVASGGDRVVPADAAAMTAELRAAEGHLQAGRFRSADEHARLVIGRLAVAKRKLEATHRDDLLAYVKVLSAGFDMMQESGSPAPAVERIIAEGRRVLADAQAAIGSGDLLAADALVKTGAELLRRTHAGAGDAQPSGSPPPR
jgi:hypothetical protein